MASAAPPKAVMTTTRKGDCFQKISKANATSARAKSPVERMELVHTGS